MNLSANFLFFLWPLPLLLPLSLRFSDTLGAPSKLHLIPDPPPWGRPLAHPSGLGAENPHGIHCYLGWLTFGPALCWEKEGNGALVVKNPPANAGDWRDTGSIPGSGRSPGGGHGHPLPAWRIQWTEEPGGLQSMRSQRVGHDWSDWAQDLVCLVLGERETKEIEVCSFFFFGFYIIFFVFLQGLWIHEPVQPVVSFSTCWHIFILWFI